MGVGATNRSADLPWERRVADPEGAKRLEGAESLHRQFLFGAAEKKRSIGDEK